MIPKWIKPNPKTHGRNICIDCVHAFKFSSKNRTCWCAIIEERIKCATECDDFRDIQDLIKIKPFFFEDDEK